MVVEPGSARPRPLLTVAYLLAVRRFGRLVAVSCYLLAMGLLLAVTITPLETLAVKYLLDPPPANVVLAGWAPLLVVLRAPACFAAARPPAGLPALTHPRSRSSHGWRTTCSGTCRGCATRRSSIRTRSSTSNTRSTSSPASRCGRSIVQDNRTGWAQGCGRLVFAAFILGSPIGLVIALVPDAIYDFYVDAPERLWGLSALQDQQLAGTLNWRSSRPPCSSPSSPTWFLGSCRRRTTPGIGRPPEAASARARCATT